MTKDNNAKAATYIPAQLGWFVLKNISDDNHPLPGFGEDISKSPVIAWRIENEKVRPVTVEHDFVFAGEHFTYLRPDGIVSSSSSREWPSIEEWFASQIEDKSAR